MDNQPLLVTAFGYTLAVGTAITDQVTVLGEQVCLVPDLVIFEADPGVGGLVGGICGEPHRSICHDVHGRRPGACSLRSVGGACRAVGVGVGRGVVGACPSLSGPSLGPRHVYHLGGPHDRVASGHQHVEGTYRAAPFLIVIRV